MVPQSRKIRMVENGRPITGCLIHKVKTYRVYKNACVRFVVTMQDMSSFILLIVLAERYITGFVLCQVLHASV